MNRVKSLRVQICLSATSHLTFEHAVQGILNSTDPVIRDGCNSGDFWKALIEKHFPELVIQRQDVEENEYGAFAEGLAAWREFNQLPFTYVMKVNSQDRSKLSEPFLAFPTEEYPIDNPDVYQEAIDVKIDELHSIDQGPADYLEIPIRGLIPVAGSKGYVVSYQYFAGGDNADADEMISYITSVDGDLSRLFTSMIHQLSQKTHEAILSIVEDEEDVIINGLPTVLPIAISVEEFSASVNTLIRHLSKLPLDLNYNNSAHIMVSVGGSPGNSVQLDMYQVIF